MKVLVNWQELELAGALPLTFVDSASSYSGLKPEVPSGYVCASSETVFVRQPQLGNTSFSAAVFDLTPTTNSGTLTITAIVVVAGTARDSYTWALAKELKLAEGRKP